MRRRMLAAALAVLATIASLSAAPSFAADALYDAARKEGGLVWAEVPLEYNKAAARDFEKRYPGVKVTLLTLGGTQIVQRFKMDKAAGKEEVDCLSSGLTEAYPDLRRKGWLAPLAGLPGWKARPAAERDPNGSYFYYANFEVVLMWNTTLVNDADAPKTVRELAEPRWKGRVVMFDPTSAGVAVPLYRWTVSVLGLGLDWVRALKADDVLLAANAAQMDEAVASGRRAVALTRDVEAFAAKKRGAPVAFRVPADGRMLHRMPLAINAAAPHPNAARLFAAWLLSPEAKKALAGEGTGGPAAKNAPAAWSLDAEKVSPEETKSFVDSVLEALKGA